MDSAAVGVQSREASWAFSSSLPQGCLQLSSSLPAWSIFSTSHPILGSGFIFFSSSAAIRAIDHYFLFQLLQLKLPVALTSCSTPQTSQALGPPGAPPPPWSPPVFIRRGKGSPLRLSELLTAAGLGATSTLFSFTLASLSSHCSSAGPTVGVAESSEADNPR